MVESLDVIARLITNNKFDNMKISVVKNDIFYYDRVIYEIFNNYDISLNKEYAISIFDSAIYRLIVCLNNFINFDIDKEDVINFLEFISNDFSYEDIYNFKNYCYTYDIRNFANEFTLCPFMNLNYDDELNVKNLKSINHIRKKIVETVCFLKSSSEKFGICKCILDFVNNENFSEMKNFQLFVSILEEMQLSEYDSNFLFELNKKIKVQVNCLGLVTISENLEFIDNDQNLVFFILDKSEKINDYLENLSKFENVYILFLNDEYLKIENKNILTEKDILSYNKKAVSHNDNNEEKLFENKTINISVSKIGIYYSCSLYYFFNCILKINKIRKFSFDHIENGILVHFIMEQYFKYFNGCDIKEKIYEIAKEYLNKRFSSFFCNQRIEHISKKYSIFLSKIVEKIINEMNKYGFSPKEFEKKFYRELYFENDLKVKLIGKIDRIDSNKDNECIILDYKTNDKRINLKNIKNGTNIQSLVYLNLLENENLKKFGFFNLLCKSGKELDNILTGFSTKDIFKDDNIEYIGEEELNDIIDYSNVLIKKMAEDIFKGTIYERPRFFKEGFLRCENCEYKKICKLYE